MVGFWIGAIAWFLVRVLLGGIYTVDQNERAVKTRFGRAERVSSAKTTLDDPIAEHLREEERSRYAYPQVRVIPPGGPFSLLFWFRLSGSSTVVWASNQTRNRTGKAMPCRFWYSALWGCSSPTSS